METILHILKVIVIIVAAFFALTFTVYMFNLDMKLTSSLEPWLDKIYDKRQRDRKI